MDELPNKPNQVVLWLDFHGRRFGQSKDYYKNKVPLSMAIGNEELVHECFPKYSRMGRAKMKYDKETDEEDEEEVE